MIFVRESSKGKYEEDLKEYGCGYVSVCKRNYSNNYSCSRCNGIKEYDKTVYENMKIEIQDYHKAVYDNFVKGIHNIPR